MDGSLRWLGVYNDEPLELEEIDKLSRAKDFLIEQLEDDMKTFNELSELAKKNGYSMRTVTRAKKELDIKSVRKDNQWYWKM